MKKIIFDLDGTLWETGNAYIYSYNKTCRQLNIPADKIQKDDYVLKYLGVKLDELVLTIIPEAEDKMLLGKMLLGNVIEYLVQNPKTYSKNIKELFSTLSAEYELYIISNCPRPFLDAFYAVSGVRDFVTGDNTIEDSNKTEAIKKITDNYSEKAIFVGDATSDYEAIENHEKMQFVYAAYGYDKCLKYDFYLENLDALPQLLEKIKPIYEILKKEDFQIVSHNKSYAALIQKKDKDGKKDCFYFGFINADNSEDFDFIIPELKKSCGNKTLYGPISGNSWYSYRIALNEFDFKLYPDCFSNEAILKKFLTEGFTVHEEYTSTVSAVNFKKFDEIDCKSHSSSLSDYEFKVIKGKNCMNYLDTIYRLSCHCFCDHSFYEEIEYEDFKALYLKLLSACYPVLILVLFKEEAVGFNFIYPDMEKRFAVDKTIAVEKKHRNPTVIFNLVKKTHEEIKELGFDKVLCHYQSANLKTMQSYFNSSALRQKRYGVLKYEASE